MARYGTVKSQMKELSATASQQPEEIRERRTQAEDVLGTLESDIGKAGTYDFPSGPVATAPTSLTGDSFRLGGDVFKETDTRLGIGATGGAGSTKTISLDKEKALGQMESSSAFRQVSRMMAESEQMLARSGPLYEDMMRSTQLPIIEGSAAMARENTENIRKAMQRGGSARRDGFAAIAKIRAQEASNVARGQALAKAHTEMDLWARNNAKEVIDFAHGWATNQAGIRESYQSAMDSATQLMSQSALPFVFGASQKEQEYRDAASAQNRGKVMKQITGVLGVVGSVVSMVYGGGMGAGKALSAANESVAGQKISTTPIASGGAGASGNYFGGGGQG